MLNGEYFLLDKKGRIILWMDLKDGYLLKEREYYPRSGRLRDQVTYTGWLGQAHPPGDQHTSGWASCEIDIVRMSKEGVVVEHGRWRFVDPKWHYALVE